VLEQRRMLQRDWCCDYEMPALQLLPRRKQDSLVVANGLGLDGSDGGPREMKYLL